MFQEPPELLSTGAFHQTNNHHNQICDARLLTQYWRQILTYHLILGSLQKVLHQPTPKSKHYPLGFGLGVYGSYHGLPFSNLRWTICGGASSVVSATNAPRDFPA